MRKTAILLLAATLITGCKFEFDLPKQEEQIVNVYSGIPQKEVDDSVAGYCMIAFAEGYFFAKRSHTNQQFKEKLAEIEANAKRSIRKRSSGFRQKNNLPPLPEELQVKE